MQLIEKPSILVTSLGRTGTEFFAKFFADMIPNSTSLHEPDIFQNAGVENKLARYFLQVRQAGAWRMVVLKAMGMWTLVKLSDGRFTGALSREQAIKKLYFQRNSFINQAAGNTYVEANIGYYGLLDITSELFQNHRAIYVVRNARDWIRSHMNWGEFYGKTGIRKLISHNWPAASELPDDPYYEKWDRLTRFEQLCWAWTRLNEYALNTIAKNPSARIYRFEDIFLKEKKYEVLEDLVNFATSLPGLDQDDLGSTAGWLERKIHQSSDGFPAWENWTREQRKIFEQTCGSLMEKLGYKISVS